MNVLVVGASGGLGAATVRALARAGCHHLILGGRDERAARAATRRLADRSVFHSVDLADLADVDRFIAAVGAGPPIDAIVCNAGVQVTRGLVRTVDGHEATFAINHLAHFAIVQGLLPVLRPGGRIVFVGSGTHDPRNRLATRFGFRGARYTSAAELAEGGGDASASERQRALDRYATSKLCHLLCAFELARRIPATRAGIFAFDPGLMPGTGLARDRGLLERLAWHTVLHLAVPFVAGMSTPRRSGAALAWVATDPSLNGQTGLYVDHRRRTVEAWEGTRRHDWAADLFDTSVSLLARTPKAPDRSDRATAP